jgi:peroxiredoxin
MAQVESFKEDIARTGSEFAYIAAENRKGFFKPARFLERNPGSFPFLLDEDRSVTKAYGLYHRFGKDAFNIAHPATLIIDRGRSIRYIYRGDNQADRAPLDAVLAGARNAAAS